MKFPAHAPAQRGVNRLMLCDAGEPTKGFADDMRRIMVVVARQIGGCEIIAENVEFL